MLDVHRYKVKPFEKCWLVLGAVGWVAPGNAGFSIHQYLVSVHRRCIRQHFTPEYHFAKKKYFLLHKYFVVAPNGNKVESFAKLGTAETI